MAYSHRGAERSLEHRSTDALTRFLVLAGRREWGRSGRMYNIGFEWALEQIVRIHDSTGLELTCLVSSAEDTAIPSFNSDWSIIPATIDPEGTEGRDILRDVAVNLYDGGDDYYIPSVRTLPS